MGSGHFSKAADVFSFGVLSELQLASAVSASDKQMFGRNQQACGGNAEQCDLLR